MGSGKPSRGGQGEGLEWKETAAWSSLLLAPRWFLVLAQGAAGRCHGPFSPPPAPDTVVPTCSSGNAALTVTLYLLRWKYGPSYSQEVSGAAGHRVSTDFCPRPPQRRPQVAPPRSPARWGQLAWSCPGIGLGAILASSPWLARITGVARSNQASRGSEGHALCQVALLSAKPGRPTPSLGGERWRTSEVQLRGPATELGAQTGWMEGRPENSLLPQVLEL